jgi:hypothetical protein
MSRHYTCELADSWVQSIACCSKSQIVFVIAMLENAFYYMLIRDRKSDGEIGMPRVAWIAWVHDVTSVEALPTVSHICPRVSI